MFADVKYAGCISEESYDPLSSNPYSVYKGVWSIPFCHYFQFDSDSTW